MPLAIALAAAAGCDVRPSAVEVDREMVDQLQAALKAGAQASDAGDEAVGFKHSGQFVTISGQFLYDGPAPAPQKINDKITKDQSVCAPGDVYSQELLVDSTSGGIQNVVVYLWTDKNRPVPIHDSAKAPSGAAPHLDQKACVFTPHVMAVHVGLEKLPISNSDPVAHNAKIAGNRGATEDSAFPPNSSGSYTLKAEETAPIPVSCAIHPWMNAYLLPRENGYFAVTDKEGKFTIENLPAGDKLMIAVWHESSSDRAGFVRVAADGVKAEKRGFSITLEDGSAPNLSIKLPPSAFSVQ
jgi:hypothetical protein